MKEIYRENKFKKDFKILVKRGKNLEKLKEIILLLADDMPLPHKCNPHKLKGEYNGLWECHIEGDWLLIYTYNESNLILHRTGRHQDLFVKY